MAFRTMLVVGIFSLAALFAIKADGPINSGYYTAAVYEHARFGDFPTDTMPKIISENLKAYGKATLAAAEKNSDIIVFPEFGLYPFTNRAIFKEYGENIPDPKEAFWNPCLSQTQESSIARNLSCLARNNNIFLVANMVSSQPCNFSDPDCPSDNTYIYNTNVVFNREGNLVARYRKYHLYFEPGVNVPKEFEYVAFTTEFGTIGTFVCFDIMWESSIKLLQKYKIDAIAFPLLWHDGLPMYTSMQTMWSWSVGNNITLLGANIQQPDIGNVGSGIFFGASKRAHYVYQPDGKSKLIISKVPIGTSENTTSFDPATITEYENSWANASNNNICSGQCSSKILGPPKNRFDYRCADMSLSNFTLVKLQRDENETLGCNNHLCCHVKYDAVDMNEDYYLAVRNSTLDMSSKYRIWEENCLIIRCDEFNGTECSTFPTKSNTVFRQLVINGNLTSTHVYPSVLTSGIHLLASDKWSYTNASLSLETDEGLLYAVLNGRSYDRDLPYIP